MIQEHEKDKQKQKLLYQIDVTNSLFQERRIEKQKILDEIDVVNGLFQKRRMESEKKIVKYVLVNRLSSKVKYYALVNQARKSEIVKKQKLLKQINAINSLFKNRGMESEKKAVKYVLVNRLSSKVKYYAIINRGRKSNLSNFAQKQKLLKQVEETLFLFKGNH